jgi:hypothetical protein
MIVINILTIDYVDGMLSFEYTLDGKQLHYKNKNTQSGWTVEELEALIMV